MNGAAVGIVLGKNSPNQVLWVKRVDLPIWVLPGGGIDQGESPETAVIREVLEETGLTVEVVRQAAVYRPVNALTDTTHVFVCKWKEGIPSITSETSEIQFFPYDVYPEPHFPLHADWLKEAFSSDHAMVDRPMTEFTWGRVAQFFMRHPWILIKYSVLRLFRSS